MLYRAAGSVYDILSYVHPLILLPQNGMNFTTTDNMNHQNDVQNCATTFGGGWWYSKCSVFVTTTAAPVWYSLGDDTWYWIQKSHLMMKLQ